MNQQRIVKRIIRVAGGLFAGGFIFLVIARYEGAEWASFLSGLCFAVLLCGPAILLLLKPGWTVIMLEVLGNMMRWRSPHRQGSPPQAPVKWDRPREWSELTDLEKISVVMISAVCMAGGVFIALVGMGLGR